METSGKFAMNCEQVQAIVLDSYSVGATSLAQRSAALAHLSLCPHCAALQESWDAAKEELRTLSEETLDARAPARVEMSVMQAFRAEHRKAAARRAGIAAVWALAAAAVVVAGVITWNAQHRRHLQSIAPDLSAGNGSSAALAAGPSQSGSNGQLVAGLAGDDSGEFTLLPGAVPADTDDAAIWRVRMQRSSLAALGLPVNEQRAGEWIQVDLMVGNDGSPEAVRLAQEEN
jgi:anti-sigma factor RsiW